MMKQTSALLIGDTGVGKTCLLNALTKRPYQNQQPTVGVDFRIGHMQKEKQETPYTIWDTSGQSRFRDITRLYYGRAYVMILVFDMTHRESFESLLEWYRFALSQCRITMDHHWILVATQLDMEKNRQISYYDADQWAREHNMDYFEVSSSKDIGIDRLRSYLLQKFTERMTPEEEKVEKSIPHKQTYCPCLSYFC